MRAFLVVLACACIALPALGDTHRIWVLGTEPLFSRTSSRAQFLEQLHRYPQREAVALKALGIDRAAFERAMRTAPSIVTGGWFHLDAMAYYANGVKIAYDVAVPRDTWMWVVHVPRKTIYVPEACGNISTVATAAVESYATAFPVTTTRRPVTPAQPPGLKPPLPQGTQIGAVPYPTPVVSAPHGGKFPWWIFIIPVAFIHGHSSSGSAPLVPVSSPSPSPSPSVVPSASPTTTPRPTSSPTTTPRPTSSPTTPPTATPCPSPTPKPTPTPCPSPTPKPTPTPCPTRTR